jgi:glycosyltransferase involved in cell wall biosynthesis
MNPILSIVTITKDDPRGLKRTLGSLKSWLSDDRIEHVLVTAENSAACEVSPSSRVVVQRSSGISGAFNEGLQAAKGEWVWFLNGGDAVHEALARDWLLSLLATTRADIVTGALHFDGESAPRPMPHLSYQWPLIACWLAHPATLVRRKTLLSVGGFDQRWRIAMDYDLWFRLLCRDAIVDVVSVPFARFDVKGVSEHRETRGAARGEEAKVVLAHGGRLGGAVVRLCLRVVRRISWALWRSLPFRFGREHETR